MGYPWSAGDQLNAADLNAAVLHDLLASTAAETIAQNAAVAAGYYQSDGGIGVDVVTAGTSVGSGSSYTASLTVASNSNRVLVVFIMSASQGVGSVLASSVQWNGVTVINVDSVTNVSANNYCWSGVLVAPATGTHNLTWTGSSAATFTYVVFSLYNCAQSGQPDSHGANSASGASLSVSFTPSNIGAAVCSATNTSPGVTGSISWSRNNTTNGLTYGYSDKIFPLQAISNGSNSTTGFLMSIAIVPFTTALLGYAVNASASNASGTYSDNYTNYRSIAFMGFATAAATATQSVKIATGGVMDAFSSLTSGLPYYLANVGGTIATTVGTISRKVGIAIDSTHLLMSNIW